MLGFLSFANRTSSKQREKNGERKRNLIDLDNVRKYKKINTKLTFFSTSFLSTKVCWRLAFYFLPSGSVFTCVQHPKKVYIKIPCSYLAIFFFFFLLLRKHLLFASSFKNCLLYPRIFETSVYTLRFRAKMT